MFNGFIYAKETTTATLPATEALNPDEYLAVYASVPSTRAHSTYTCRGARTSLTSDPWAAHDPPTTPLRPTVDRSNVRSFIRGVGLDYGEGLAGVLNADLEAAER